MHDVRRRRTGHRTRLVRVAALSATSAIMLLLPAGQANAGEFTINSCQADRGNYSSSAFEDFATRGMKLKRACDPEGHGLRGLITANVVRAGRVPRVARSSFQLRAPDGTRFVRFRWSGQARRRDCRYALQLYADRPDGPPIPIKNVRANQRCPGANRAQSAGWPRPQTYDVTGATRIVQRVVCVGSSARRSCSSRGLNYVRTFKAAATVADVSAPSVEIIQDTPLTRGEWVNDPKGINYNTSDNIGVRTARAIFGGADNSADWRPCNYALRTPCPNGRGTSAVQAQKIPEGTQGLAVAAED